MTARRSGLLPLALASFAACAGGELAAVPPAAILPAASAGAPGSAGSAGAAGDGGFGPPVTSIGEGGAPAGGQGGQSGQGGQGSPALPPLWVGLDAIRHWDRLPYLRLGTRTYMRSTYDRSGGNEAADASHFLRQDSPTSQVALDLAGPGLLTFVRTNHWHGSPWHYGIDGTDHVVTETSTADPDHPAPGSVFLPEAAFPSPLTYTWAATRGADLSWVPMGFAEGLTLGYERSHYGTGYYIYSLFAAGEDRLTEPLLPWNEQPPAGDVIALLGRAGQDIAPSGDGVAVTEGQVNVAAGSAATLLEGSGPRTLRVIRLRLPEAQASALESARLRISWGGAEPSVDAPVPLFFGAGTLHNRNKAEYLVKAMLASIRFVDGDIELSSYFPMPYLDKAKVEVVAGAAKLDGLRYHLRSVPYDDPPAWIAPFHATYRDHPSPVAGRDLVLLDTTQVEGGGDFCGSFVGTSWIFSHRADLTTLEGDPRFFFDDSESPQAQGTGTEEWGGGGDYWGGQTMTLPFAGHPVGAPSADAADSERDKIESAYRFLVSDLFPFGKNARIQLEHGGINESVEHYESVTYWYGAPGSCLTMTDELHPGDLGDEAAHRYVSPDASGPESLTSRYELGPDHLGDQEIFAAETDSGRHTSGTSSFSLRIDPNNVGVLLRRKLDYGLADQRALVRVGEDRDGAPLEAAGVWYLAGSNRCVFVDAPTETGAGAPVAQESNRRLREDEFLLPRRMTAGRSHIRVELAFSPDAHPLAPGMDAPPTAWSELRYRAYSYVLPAR